MQNSVMRCWVNVSIIVAALALFGLSGRFVLFSQLNGYSDGTVIRIEQDPDNDRLDRNYLVYYRFQSDKQAVFSGVYMLENPTSLGEMPRMGSYVRISYSRFDPGINRPSTDDPTDITQLFFGSICAVLGAILLVAGLGLRR